MQTRAIIFVAALIGAGCSTTEPQPEPEGPASQAQVEAAADPMAGQQSSVLQAYQAPARIPVSPALRVGWHATQKTTQFGQEYVTSYAIVGEQGDTWLVEHVNPGFAALLAGYPELEGTRLGLTVRKADGRVLKAVAGKPGEKGTELQVTEDIPLQSPPAPQGVRERVAVPAGTFQALRTESAGTTVWTGLDGAVEGVVLKMTGAQEKALTVAPTEEKARVGDVELSVIRTAYDDGEEVWTTLQPAVHTWFRGSFRHRTAQMERAVVELGTGAQPTLAW